MTNTNNQGSVHPGKGCEADTTPIRRAATHEDIKPLIELCKAGKLFEVQDWIAAGHPVNPPPLPEKGHRPKSPLEISIRLGFHSLAKVLLRARAIIEPDDYDGPMIQALQMRRFDIVQLLVEHGYDPKSVDMNCVFNSWDPEMMEYFIELGAEVEDGNPLAYALSCRIRTALRILKKYRDRFPSFPEQANIALRHHCKDGNIKWVSLMLWAGADPYKPGAECYSHEVPPEFEGLTALELAAMHRHLQIFDLKQLRLDAKHPVVRETIFSLSDEQGFALLRKLLDAGMDPNQDEDSGCSAFQSLLHMMDFDFDPWTRELRRKNIDSSRARDKIKAIHLLAKHGARWMPRERSEINDARRSLLRLVPGYTVEFVWIMSKYKACSLEAIETLLRTPTMKSHTAAHRERLQQILICWRSADESRPCESEI